MPSTTTLLSQKQQLCKCPLCKHDYDTQHLADADNNKNAESEGEDGNVKSPAQDHLPTSCRWCMKTICRACVQTLPRNSGNVVCPHCDKAKAFHATQAVVHELSCQLLELLQKSQHENTSTKNNNQQLMDLSTEPTGMTSVTPEPTRRRMVAGMGVISLEELMTQNKNKNSDKSIREHGYAAGTPVCRNGTERGTIESVSTNNETLYTLRFGDGDPIQVSFQEMKAMVEAAKEQNGSNRYSSDSTFIGQDVYKLFPGLGSFKGKVVDCTVKRFYTIVFDDQKKETMVPHETVESWVEGPFKKKVVSSRRRSSPALAAARPTTTKNDEVEEATDNSSLRSRKKRSTSIDGSDLMPSGKKAKFTLADYNKIAGDDATLEDPQPPKKKRGRPPKNAKPDGPTPPPPPQEQPHSSKVFKLPPAKAQFTGWKGFEQHVSDKEGLPKTFREALVLMDFLFKVARGQETFVARLYENSGKKEGWFNGDDVRVVLRELKKENPKDFKWHVKGSHYVPSTKSDLESFLRILIRLKMAPELDSPEEAKEWKPTGYSRPSKYFRDVADKQEDINNDSSSSSGSSSSDEEDSEEEDDVPIKSLKGSPKNPKASKGGLKLGDSLLLPEEDRATGWKGFNKHVFDDALPKKMRMVFEMLDFLFPVAAGEETFVTVHDERKKMGNGLPGSDICARLRLLKDDQPDHPGLKWHKMKTPYVPKTKKDLKRFMLCLVNDLDVAPKVASKALLNEKGSD
ncbi:expressed unknown protein [Seminavis robusta]|uniref:Uncharacterized protein n=1 Tax=Seminavis robusta TaxID=568900 RepID=A0A9N8E590_9STRA|nr:expressed unknown protein [Seminavis robusta]|eukprot:Sro673_g185240.1 n/a (740) ;mRNA; f:27769-29988